jgi:hypothetical protein
MRSFSLFQGFRSGYFYDVSAGDFCPFRILLDKPFDFTQGIGLSAMSSRPNGSELRLPPLIRREKHSGLPPVTAEKTSCPPDIPEYLMLAAVTSMLAIEISVAVTFNLSQSALGGLA